MKTIIEELKKNLLRVRWNSFFKRNKLPEITLEDLEITLKPFTPSISEEICLPPFRGDEDLNDYSVLFSLLDFCNPKLVLELGTGYGNTVANICSRLDSKVITVNALPDQISGRVTTYSLSRENIGKVYRSNGFADRVVQIYADTKTIDLGDLLSERCVDFAIVDACHDSDYVLNDFRKIQPYMAPGSVVVFHDTHPSMQKHYIDSYIACMYLRKLGHNIKYIKNSSWAIWFANEALVNKNRSYLVTSPVANFFERKIFGSEQTDLLRIRGYAKRHREL